MLIAAVGLAACGGEDELLLFQGSNISALSADETHLYFAVDGVTYRIDKDGGEAKAIAQSADESHFPIESVTDGTTVYLLERGGALEMVGVDGEHYRGLFTDTVLKSSLCMDDENVYWLDQQLPALALWGIRSFPRAGGSGNWVFLTQGTNAIEDMALGSEEIYFITREKLEVNAVKKDGRHAAEVIATLETAATQIAVVDDVVFVAEANGAVHRIIRGQQPQQVYHSSSAFNGMLVADHDGVYVGSRTALVPGRVDRVPIEGGAPTELFEVDQPTEFVTDAEWIYYVDGGYRGHSLRRARK
jgi:hypothetical protein